MGASTSVAAQLAALASMLAADDAALLSMVASAANTGARANAPGGALFGVILDALVDGLAVSDAARLAGVISALHGTGSLQGLGHGTDVPGVVLPGAGL